MKKNDSKKNIKAARKLSKVKIEESLIAHLTSLTSENNKANSKLVKTIRKGSTQLAKKISELIKVDKNVVPAVKDVSTNSTETKTAIASAPEKKVVPTNSKSKTSAAIKPKTEEKLAE